MFNKNNKLTKQTTSDNGFTLMELVVTISLLFIIGYAATSIYLQLAQTHRRQQRVLQVERSLLNTHNSLKQSLVTLPGRGLGVATQGFSIPILPTAGNIFNPATGKSEPIKLGLITPYKVNGSDGFMVIYADAKFPRLPISQNTIASNDIGIAKIPLPFLTQPNVGSSGGDGKQDKNLASIQKGTPTPEPSPSATPTPTPSPSPEPTKVPSQTGTTGTPPNIPITETLSGLPFYGSREMYNVGDLMLLVGAPAGVVTKLNPDGEVQAHARIVRLTGVTPSIGSSIGSLNQQYLDFTYDLCLSGECDQKLPGISNSVNTPTSFRVGSILVPLKVASFYLKKDAMGSRLIRNDNGVILPVGDGTFAVVGGTESILGEVDSINIKYVLNNESVENTPINPNVPWLNDIKSVDVSLVRAMPAVKGTEDLTRVMNINFPLIIKHLE